MTLTRELLDTRYAWWFHNKRNAEQAKREILIIFSKELDDYFECSLSFMGFKHHTVASFPLCLLERY